MDRSRPALAAAARSLASPAGGARAARGDAAALPFRDGAFDLVLAVTVLCFAGDPAAAVREMARVLRPLDAGLGRRTTLGAAFLVVEARKP